MSHPNVCSVCQAVAVVISEAKFFCATCYPAENYLKSSPRIGGGEVYSMGYRSDIPCPASTAPRKSLKPTVIRRRMYEK